MKNLAGIFFFFTSAPLLNCHSRIHTFCFLIDFFLKTQQQRRVGNEKNKAVCSKLLLQVRLWEGNQEEEVSLWATGSSPSAADIRLLAAHHGPAHQHRAPEKVRLRMVSVQLGM